MDTFTRRAFLQTASLATLAASAPALAKPVVASHRRQRVFIASGSKDGILAYNWDPASGELTRGRCGGADCRGLLDHLLLCP